MFTFYAIRNGHGKYATGTLWVNTQSAIYSLSRRSLEFFHSAIYSLSRRNLFAVAPQSAILHSAIRNLFAVAPQLGVLPFRNLFAVAPQLGVLPFRNLFAVAPQSIRCRAAIRNSSFRNPKFL